jgi:hypothetical protein
MASAPAPFNLNDPANRATVIRQYESYGENFIQREYGVNRMRIARWRKLFDSQNSFSPRFDLIGAKSKLSPREQRKLESELIKNPYATNEELSNTIMSKITPQAVGKRIAKSTQEFTWKLEQVDVEQTFSPEIVQEGLQFLKETHNIPHDKRVYVDETFATAGIPRQYGRFPKGRKPWSRRNRKYSRIVVVGAITKKGWLHPSKLYHKASLTDKDFDSYVKNVLAPKLKKGQVVFWDQYGKFGRTRNPIHRHWSAKAKDYIERRGAKVKMLPRYGKENDPIEMIFGDAKKNYFKLVRSEVGSEGPSKLTFATKSKLWKQAENSVGPKSFTRAFKERASGKEFKRVAREKGLL